MPMPRSRCQKWEKVWDEVKYCSDRCRNERKAAGHMRTGGTP